MGLKPAGTESQHFKKGDKHMTQENVISRIRELKELEEMADELTGMIESIKDELKLFMQEEQTEEYDAGAYIMRYTTVLSNRFDSTAFKKVMPDVYKAYTKQVTSRRFSVA